MRTIPVDLILHETALKLRELPEEHHRGLADAIYTYAVDHRAIADQWDSGAGNGAGVCQSARWLITNRLDAQAFAPNHVFAESRAMEVAVARRLADCALSLLVTQDAEGRAATSTLLAAAHRVVGLERSVVAATTVGAWPPVVTIANLKAAEAENANKASIIAKQEKFIANLKSAALVGVAGVIADALHLEAKPGDSDPATLSRRCVEAIERLQATAYARAKERDVEREEVAARGELLKRAHDDRDRFLANLRKALNMDEGLEGDVLTAIARLRDNLDRSNNAGEVSARAFKVGDVVRFARVHPESEPDGRPPLGWLGTITRIGDMTFPFKVEGQRYDGDLDVPCWWFAAESLDLVTPTA